jgi:peptide chain release factor
MLPALRWAVGPLNCARLPLDACAAAGLQWGRLLLRPMSSSPSPLLPPPLPPPPTLSTPSVHPTSPSRLRHSRASPVPFKVPGGARRLLFSEEDVDESFARGAGRGGQSVSKTANCVRLTHRPTGITVRCHATRNRDMNRQMARRELQMRLDDAVNGAASVRNAKGLARRAKEKKRGSKARARHAGLAALKTILRRAEEGGDAREGEMRDRIGAGGGGGGGGRRGGAHAPAPLSQRPPTLHAHVSMRREEAARASADSETSAWARQARAAWLRKGVKGRRARGGW